MVLKLSIVFLSLFILLQPKDIKVEQSPLELKITSRLEDSCFEQKFLLQAEIVNKSVEKVVIDKNAVWYRISFSRSGGSSTRVGDAGSDYKGDYLILLPGESYKSERTINLDNDFFNTSGDYQVSLSYGQFTEETYQEMSVWRGIVESNESSFKLKTGKILDT